MKRQEPRSQAFQNPETQKVRHLLMVPDHLGTMRPMLDGETGKPIDFMCLPGRVDRADIDSALAALDRAKRAASFMLSRR